MKLKIDFITNSSSASFTICKSNLTELQIYQIKNHIQIIKEFSPDNYSNDPWKISETDKFIRGSTMMDNFDMLWFLSSIGVKQEYIDYIDQNMFWDEV